MKTISGKDICLILSQHGFIKVRQKVSHVIMQKLSDDSTITVPVPMHKEIKIGTLHSIIRQSELSKRDFE
ncbi:MAG: type II toxin-antitoxin system HicA family toxin [Saprospiraceae bacterium]|nr:type II toxin-antitoxin system HicA family toxin [Saprospiraceae bacterium]MBK7738913.1 type II toxin-antitoxin system HicA family toxin [Saprospiraceae bacterium]MBK7912520.1 type II toxin-antitoxin system HicA family toxin [Saprospiraceae bacterium]